MLAGTIAGAEGLTEIRRWAVLHMDFLRRLLPFSKGIPSHDTLNDIIDALDGDIFTACFSQWVSSLGGTSADPATGLEVVAIDGKTSRRTHDRAQARDPLHLVSAWASGQRLVLGQQACEAKSSDITAIPLLLDRLAIRGAMVTIDAMGRQTRISQKILNREADCLLAVKHNWPNLHAEIARAFDDSDVTRLSPHDTLDGDHGRIENRLHWVLDVVFHADLSRLRSGNGPQNMATVRHVALNLLRGVKDKHSLKVRRTSAAWDHAYLEIIIRQVA